MSLKKNYILSSRTSRLKSIAKLLYQNRAAADSWICGNSKQQAISGPKFPRQLKVCTLGAEIAKAALQKVSYDRKTLLFETRCDFGAPPPHTPSCRGTSQIGGPGFRDSPILEHPLCGEGQCFFLGFEKTSKKNGRFAAEKNFKKSL